MINNKIFDVPDKTLITDLRGIWYPNQNVDN